MTLDLQGCTTITDNQAGSGEFMTSGVLMAELTSHEEYLKTALVVRFVY